MPINGSTFNEGATISSSGGTAKTLTYTGGNADRSEFYVEEDSSSITRRTLTAERTQPRVSGSAPGGYTQERETVKLVQPKTLANTNRTHNTATFTLSCDPETTDAEKLLLVQSLGELIVSGQVDDLFTKQNTQ
jgi:hypothetical protein